MGDHVYGLVEPREPPQRHQVRDASAAPKRRAVKICRHRAVVYEQERQRNPRPC